MPTGPSSSIMSSRSVQPSWSCRALESDAVIIIDCTEPGIAIHRSTNAVLAALLILNAAVPRSVRIAARR